MTGAQTNMSIAIVTDSCYLVCESINYINLQEAGRDMNTSEINRKGSKIIPDKDKFYEITIDFVAKSNKAALNNSDYNDTLKFKIRGKKDAQRVFKMLVNQIRDQMPDELYLNKLMEGILK